MGTGSKGKIKLTFSWSLLKHLVYGLFSKFENILHALAVLGHLPKLRRVMGLVFSPEFLHSFSIKMLFINIKWLTFTIWGVWPKRLRYYQYNKNVPGWNPTRHSVVICLSRSQLWAMTKGTASLTLC